MADTIKTSPGRIEYFDLLKGIAIFLVVMGHVLTMCIRNIDSAFTFKIISEIHMPLFFFISGYLTYKSSRTKSFLKPDLWKRFKQLIIPFVVVSALWIWYFPHSGLLSPISDSLTDMYQSYWKDGYWFTLCLFEIFLIYYPLSILLSKIKNSAWQIILTIAVYAALIILARFLSFPAENKDILGIGLLTSFFPVFMTGLFAAKYKEKFSAIVNNSLWFVDALFIFIFCWYYTVYFWEFPMLPDWVNLITRPLEHFGLIIIAITAIQPWSKKEFNFEQGNKPSIVARYFKFLGKESLAIYLIHYFFLFPLTPLQEPLKSIGLPMVPLLTVSIIAAFLVIAATLLVNYIIQRNKYLSFILIGKDNANRMQR